MALLEGKAAQFALPAPEQQLQAQPSLESQPSRPDPVIIAAPAREAVPGPSAERQLTAEAATDPQTKKMPERSVGAPNGTARPAMTNDEPVRVPQDPKTAAKPKSNESAAKAEAQHAAHSNSQDAAAATASETAHPGTDLRTVETAQSPQAGQLTMEHPPIEPTRTPSAAAQDANFEAQSIHPQLPTLELRGDPSDGAQRPKQPDDLSQAITPPLALTNRQADPAQADPHLEPHLPSQPAHDIAQLPARDDANLPQDGGPDEHLALPEPALSIEAEPESAEDEPTSLQENDDSPR